MKKDISKTAKIIKNKYWCKNVMQFERWDNKSHLGKVENSIFLRPLKFCVFKENLISIEIIIFVYPQFK